jgi:hypothetical protein
MNWKNITVNRTNTNTSTYVEKIKAKELMVLKELGKLTL